MVVLGGGAVSYERGTPVHLKPYTNSSTLNTDPPQPETLNGKYRSVTKSL